MNTSNTREAKKVDAPKAVNFDVIEWATQGLAINEGYTKSWYLFENVIK